jgi:probable rRNA maturation factor
MVLEINNQGKFPVDLKYCQKMIRRASRRLGISPVRTNLSLAFVSDQAIRKLNRIYRGEDHPTDVLSFNLREDQKGGPRNQHCLGEIIISYPQARRQAAARKKPVEREIALLIVHGLLHLLGHDHQKPAERRIMEDLQAKIMGED